MGYEAALSRKYAVIFIVTGVKIELMRLRGEPTVIAGDIHRRILEDRGKDPEQFRPDILHRVMMDLVDSGIGRMGAAILLSLRGDTYEFPLSRFKVPRSYTKFAEMFVDLLIQRGSGRVTCRAGPCFRYPGVRPGTLINNARVLRLCPAPKAPNAFGELLTVRRIGPEFGSDLGASTAASPVCLALGCGADGALSPEEATGTGAENVCVSAYALPVTAALRRVLGWFALAAIDNDAEDNEDNNAD